MSFFRKKLDRVTSGAKAEPTDNPMFGAGVDRETFEAIDQTGAMTWAVREREEDEREPTESNYPEAWRAGRELARFRYGVRLREHDPIPTDPVSGTKAAAVEALAMQAAINMYIAFPVNRGEMAADAINGPAISTCCISFGQALAKLFTDHWA